MVLGNDLGMENVELMSESTIVGKFMNIQVCLSSLKEWCNNSGWNKFLGYSTLLYVLLKGWVCFVFSLSSDVSKVLNC